MHLSAGLCQVVSASASGRAATHDDGIKCASWEAVGWVGASSWHRQAALPLKSVQADATDHGRCGNARSCAGLLWCEVVLPDGQWPRPLHVTDLPT